jgi:hypothetical protein
VLPEAATCNHSVLVPRVDRDGNEIGGERLPDIAVPLASALKLVPSRRISFNSINEVFFPFITSLILCLIIL